MTVSEAVQVNQDNKGTTHRAAPWKVVDVDDPYGADLEGVFGRDADLELQYS